MRILVTGATGLLGWDLLGALSPRHSVFGWARGLTIPFPKEKGPAALEAVDVTDEQAVQKRLMELRPEVVIHAAAMTDVDACHRDPEAARRVNVGGAQAVARACAASGAFLIAISTDYVFDGMLGRPYQETDPIGPVSIYGQTKWEGEQVVLRYGPRSLVVRVSGLFGSARQNFVSEAARRLKGGETVPAVSDQVNSPSYTKDLAEGFSRIVERLELGLTPAPPEAFTGLLHLVNRGGASRVEVAEAIAGHLAAPRRLIAPTTWKALNRPARRPPDSRLDCGRYEALTGIRLRPWRVAVQAFLDETS